MERRCKDSRSWHEAKNRVDVSTIGQNHLVRVRRAHENVAHVKRVEWELHVRSDAVATNAQRKSRLASGDVTECCSIVDLWCLRLENNRHLLRGIRPNFTLAWIDFDDVVVEEKFVVGNKLQANSTWTYTKHASSLVSCLLLCRHDCIQRTSQQKIWPFVYSGRFG